jgi:hypothetical protein
MNNRINDAICWDGVYATLGMYVVYNDPSRNGALSFESGDISPVKAVKPFVLEDEAQILGGRTLVYYEVKLRAIPTDLQNYLQFCIRQAFQRRAVFLWFAFDGAFDFDHILTDDVANQIYCVVGPDEVFMAALNDSLLLSDEWKSIISSKRSELFK